MAVGQLSQEIVICDKKNCIKLFQCHFNALKSDFDIIVGYFLMPQFVITKQLNSSLIMTVPLHSLSRRTSFDIYQVSATWRANY